MTERSIEASGDLLDRPHRLDLGAFVPALIRQRHLLSRSSAAPLLERFETALLLADLTGFSTLAERLAGRGPRGAEDLKNLLDVFFGRLVDIVHGHGGDILKFPGDAVLAIWPADRDGIGRATLGAVACGLAAQQALKHARASDGAQLQMRVGLGTGELWAATVGGVENRWELLVGGEPLRQASRSIAAGSPGDVVISPEVADVIGRQATISKLSNLTFRVEALSAASPPFASTMAVARESDASAVVRAYVPRSIQTRLDAGQTDWLGEFRRVSALFINLTGFDGDGGQHLAQLQPAIAAVQTIAYRYGGSINQVLVDDKGTVVLCGWGIALHSHADDEVRAVRAAFELRRELTHLGLRGAFGLATGDVFTGLRGNPQRCEYAMIGDVVNVAARLMQAADGDILCDLESCEGAAKRFEFETLPPITVKGRERPVPVYRPLAPSASRPAEIVGRSVERRQLRERLEGLASAGRGGVIIVEGDAGIGKSRLMSDLIERAVARGVRAIVAAGDEIERSAPYHVWRALFDGLLGVDDSADRAVAERRARALLESNEELLPFAPLLNPVLRVNFPDSEQSEAVPPRGRAVLTRDLLVHLFRRATGGQATLLVLEDAHWFDSGSWALASGIQRQLPEILLVIAMRPVSQAEKAPELLALAEVDGALALRLRGLSSDDTRSLACQRLRARALSEPVARLILEQAEGHPFFAEELAYALRDHGLVEIADGVCQFTAAAASQPIQLPNTVQVVVHSRIDQLSVPQQLTMKVASIFGRTFELAALRAAYPIEVAETDLRGHLQALIDRDLVHAAPSESSPTYIFNHAITQEVTYGLLAFALRRRLHATVAGWYEKQHADHLAPYYPVLAHHWARAEVVDRTLFYLDKSGEQAMNRFANEEAIRFLSEAMDLDDKLAPQLTSDVAVNLGANRRVSGRDVRRIRWHRSLGDAAINLGKWAEGQQHFEQALVLTGHGLPTSKRRCAISLGGEVLRQLARRLGPSRVSQPSPEAADLLREAVRAYQRIGSISYLHDDTLPVIYTLVAALNLAERLGPTSEFGLVCADVGNVLGLLPIGRLARAYHRRARQTAAGLDDQAASARVIARTAVYRLGQGDWSACDDLEALMTRCDQVGDSYLWEENAAVRSRAAHLRGEFELGARLGGEVRRRAAATGSLAHEIWGLDGEIWGILHLGQHDAALALAEAGLRLVAQAKRTDRLAQLDFLGARALAHLYRGELTSARQAAEQIVDTMATAPRPGYFAVLGMSAAAETFLTLWEADPRSAPRSGTVDRTRYLCRQIERYGRVHPPAFARALLWRGWAEALDGRSRQADAAWRRSLEVATRFALPYEISRVHYEIGRRLPRADPERYRHLSMSHEGFLALKAAADVGRAAAALA